MAASSMPLAFSHVHLAIPGQSAVSQEPLLCSLGRFHETVYMVCNRSTIHTAIWMQGYCANPPPLSLSGGEV